MTVFADFLKKHYIAVVAVFLLFFIFGYWYFKKSEKPAYDFIVAERGDIIREVNVTGRVKAAEEVNLSFEKSGKASRIYVDVGDRVAVGQILVELDSADLAAQLYQAEASVKAEEAKLEELKAGTRIEDIRIKERELEKAKQDLANYWDGVPDILNDAYAKTDDAVKKKMDDFFLNDDGSNPQLSFTTSNFQVTINAESKRLALSSKLNEWNDELKRLKIISSEEIFNLYLKNAEARLILTKDLLDNLMEAIINAPSVSQSTITSYKSSINEARVNINAELSDINGREQAIASQKITVQKIQDELNLKLAGATPEEIKAQEAKLEGADGSVKNIKAQISKTKIYSPIKGIIVRQKAKIGEIIVANVSVISVISADEFEIEANVPEADIAKIKINDPAKVTLDAYGEEIIFEARVISIDPAETILEGVATYKIKLLFTEKDDRLKSGMTADISILTAMAENAIVVPQRAITVKNVIKTIKILDGEEVKEKEVKIGLRGSDGNVEIIEGIKEGDKVIIGNK
ncbi:efflux RND transporter periplasmic adaptor subunit [Candidatus Wolfebacteria bacterium]|nr:efflux RND transporter periplasmic adaptor subunit [Candidatus Wolfebacteria bacterium]